MTTTPEMTKRDGDLGWIAATPTDHALRIAVMGATEEEARRRFEERLAFWEALPVARES